MKHKITYEELGEKDTVSVGRYGNTRMVELERLKVVCSCGWEDNNRDYGFLPNSDGSISKHTRTLGWNHIVKATDPSNSKGAPMELVGRIIKKRVTNEIWIGSLNGEGPDTDEMGKSRWGKNRWAWMRSNNDYSKTYPWMVLRKHSRGWVTEAGPFQLKEYAYANAIEQVQSGYVEGFEIELATEVDMDTIELPLGTIDSYFQRLAERAKEAQDPEDLVLLHKKIEKALAVTTMLESAREAVQAKLLFNE